MTTLRLPLTALRVWSSNPRKTVDPQHVARLAESFRAEGQIDAAKVRALDPPDGAITHEITDGQCRFIAAPIAGLDTLLCTVEQVDDIAALVRALTANAQREATPPLEEADAIDTLVTAHKQPVELVASRLGRPRAYVERRLALRRLAPVARLELTSGRLPLGHAEALARLEPTAQEQVISRYAQPGVEYPALKVFTREVIGRLHNLAHTPWSVTDARMPGGACDVCPKRSDKQTELFGAPVERSDTAACLDAACWDRKAEEHWKRAKADARKRKLLVIENTSEVFDARGLVRDRSAYVVYRGPEHDGLAPCAIVRDADGHVVELHDRGQVDAVEAERARAREADAEPTPAKPERPTRESKPAPAASAPVEGALVDAARAELASCRRAAMLSRLNELLLSDGEAKAFAVIRELTFAISSDYPDETRVAIEISGVKFATSRIEDLAQWHRAFVLATAAVQLFHGLGADASADDPTTAAMVAALGLEPAASTEPTPHTGAEPQAAPTVPQRVSVPAGAWNKHKRELLGTKGAALVAAWKPVDGKRVAVIEPGLVLEQVRKVALEHGIEIAMEAAS